MNYSQLTVSKITGIVAKYKVTILTVNFQNNPKHYARVYLKPYRRAPQLPLHKYYN